MDDLFLFKIYFLLVEIVSIPLAFYLEGKRKKTLPQAQPYKWGFFIGCTGLAFAPVAMFSLYHVIFLGIRDLAFLVVGFLWPACMSLFGAYTIKRRRWAWVLGTILSLNPILWGINGFYLRNRWAEFRIEAGANLRSPSQVSVRDLLNRLNGWQRIGVVLSVLWVFFVCGYSVYEYVRGGSGTRYLIEMVRADNMPFSKPPSFEDFDQKPRIKVGFLFAAIVGPLALVWGMADLVIIAARWIVVLFHWIAAGFRKKSGG